MYLLATLFLFLGIYSSQFQTIYGSNRDGINETFKVFSFPISDPTNIKFFKDISIEGFKSWGQSSEVVDRENNILYIIGALKKNNITNPKADQIIIYGIDLKLGKIKSNITLPLVYPCAFDGGYPLTINEKTLDLYVFGVAIRGKKDGELLRIRTSDKKISVVSSSNITNCTGGHHHFSSFDPTSSIYVLACNTFTAHESATIQSYDLNTQETTSIDSPMQILSLQYYGEIADSLFYGLGSVSNLGWVYFQYSARFNSMKLIRVIDGPNTAQYASTVFASDKFRGKVYTLLEVTTFDYRFVDAYVPQQFQTSSTKLKVNQPQHKPKSFHLGH